MKAVNAARRSGTPGEQGRASARVFVEFGGLLATAAGAGRGLTPRGPKPRLRDRARNRLRLFGERLKDPLGISRVAEQVIDEAFALTGQELSPRVRGRVATRINLAENRTRFTPLRDSGHPSAAGWKHVVDGHFDRPASRSRSVFTITQSELRMILQSDQVVGAPVLPLPGGAVPTGG